jgi:hypothetical protein
MKSPVKLRVMRILLDGKPHSEIDLATGVGFTKVATIRKWIESFERARFIIRKHDVGRTGYCCQLNCTRDVIWKIYNYMEFRAIRPEIRKAAWFCPCTSVVKIRAVTDRAFFRAFNLIDTAR